MMKKVLLACVAFLMFAMPALAGDPWEWPKDGHFIILKDRPCGHMPGDTTIEVMYKYFQTWPPDHMVVVWNWPNNWQWIDIAEGAELMAHDEQTGKCRCFEDIFIYFIDKYYFVMDWPNQWYRGWELTDQMVDLFFSAASSGDLRMLEFMLEAQPQLIYARTWRDRKTALHIATQNGKTDAVKILLAHGASPVACDIYSKDSYWYAKVSYRNDIIKLLEDYGATKQDVKFFPHHYTKNHPHPDRLPPRDISVPHQGDPYPCPSCSCTPTCINCVPCQDKSACCAKK